MDINIDKERLKQLSEQWIKIDDSETLIKSKLSDLRDKKQIIEKNILEITNSQNLLLTVNDTDKLSITKEKRYTTLSFKFIEKALEDIILDEDKRLKTINHIKHKRDVNTVTQIKRVSNKRNINSL